MRVVREGLDGKVNGAGLTAMVRELREQSMPVHERVNAEVAEMYGSGLVRDIFVVGPVVLERSYHGSCGKTASSHEVIQAGLSAADGLVAIYWDSDEYLIANFDPPAALVDFARSKAEPIEKAEPIVRNLISLHAEAMLVQLQEEIVVYR